MNTELTQGKAPCLAEPPQLDAVFKLFFRLHALLNARQEDIVLDGGKESPGNTCSINDPAVIGHFEWLPLDLGPA